MLCDKLHDVSLSVDPLHGLGHVVDIVLQIPEPSSLVNHVLPQGILHGLQSRLLMLLVNLHNFVHKIIMLFFERVAEINSITVLL
jgi:hypothetical protein